MTASFAREHAHRRARVWPVLQTLGSLPRASASLAMRDLILTWLAQRGSCHLATRIYGCVVSGSRC